MLAMERSKSSQMRIDPNHSMRMTPSGPTLREKKNAPAKLELPGSLPAATVAEAVLVKSDIAKSVKAVTTLPSRRLAGSTDRDMHFIRMTSFQKVLGVEARIISLLSV